MLLVQVTETEILLECADGVIVELPVKNCGSMLLETLSSSSLQLEDIFKIGQMLAFKVVKPAALAAVTKRGLDFSFRKKYFKSTWEVVRNKFKGQYAVQYFSK